MEKGIMFVMTHVIIGTSDLGLTIQLLADSSHRKYSHKKLKIKIHMHRNVYVSCNKCKLTKFKNLSLCLRHYLVKESANDL